MTLLVSTLLICASGASAAEGDKGWISKGATFTIIGEEAEKAITTFTDPASKYYNSRQEDAYALSLNPSADAGVIIDLGKEQPIRSVVIKNRGNSANQLGLTLYTSSDATTWKKVWTATKAEFAWYAELPGGTRLCLTNP